MPDGTAGHSRHYDFRNPGSVQRGSTEFTDVAGQPMQDRPGPRKNFVFLFWIKRPGPGDD